MTDHDEAPGGDAGQEREGTPPRPRVDPRAGYAGLPDPPPPPPEPPTAALPATPPTAQLPAAQLPAARAEIPADAPPPGAFGPPPYAPPPPGGGHGIGPVEYGGGFGAHLPPPPPPPAAPRPPRDQRLALTAALLNLSGLGLGHLYLRRWWHVLPSLLLTAALLAMALPVTADGVSGRWVALYAAGVLLLAADAWRLARPAGPERRPLLAPVVAGVLLLAIPAGAVVFFGDAQRRALESDLQDRLTATDELVERAAADPFGESEDRYRSAVTDYLGVRDAHPDTDAAAEVPDRLDALYERATAPADGADGAEETDHCRALAPLRFFRDLPDDTGDDPETRRLSARATDALPEPLHGCGLRLTSQRDIDGAEVPFTELLRDHADSPFATGLPDELGGMRNAAIEGVEGDDPCGSLGQLRDYNALFAELPGEEFPRMAAEGEEPVPDGLWACGTAQFRDGDFADSEETLRELLDVAPDHEEADYAGDVLIAAQIAVDLPAAGEDLPPRPGSGAGGATIEVEIFNDSPDPLELLWTGPRTGSRTIDACASCDYYPSVTDDDETCAEDIDYPSTTLELPAGSYHFLHRAPETGVSTLAETEVFEPDYIYTWCTYTTEDQSLLPGGPGGTDA
ncbi:hypothetical protein [Streptomyces sp. NPDC049879]|uniref:hypothetical protein n=1 Tax=Streptomyces sp. NPDC049879 TaxID=3365598 RepID=UPI0037AEDFF4